MATSLSRRRLLELSVVGTLGTGVCGLGWLVHKSRTAAKQLSDL